MPCSSLISSAIRRQVVGKQTTRIIISASQSTVAYQNNIPYEKPHNVEQWETLATKELSKSSKSVDSLRTERVTPVSVHMFLILQYNEFSSILVDMFFSYLLLLIIIGRDSNTTCIL